MSGRPSCRRYAQLQDAAWLRREYEECSRTTADIAADVGCSKGTVSRALRDHRIPVRVGNFRHGLRGHPAYAVWQGIMRRCYDPRFSGFEHYGGRGITACERWHDVRKFVEDVGGTYSPGAQLHRIDNDGNYEPGNVMWLPAAEHTRLHQLRLRTAEARVQQLEKALTEAGIPLPASPFDERMEAVLRDR